MWGLVTKRAMSGSPAAELALVKSLSLRPPAQFPVFLAANQIIMGQMSDGECDLLLCDPLESSYLAVECKVLDERSGLAGRKLRQASRSTVKKQALRVARRLCVMFRRPVSAGVFVSSLPGEIAVLARFDPRSEGPFSGGEWLCSQHGSCLLADHSKPFCSNRSPCRNSGGCSWQFPCKMVHFRCRHGCCVVRKSAPIADVGWEAYVSEIALENVRLIV